MNNSTLLKDKLKEAFGRSWASLLGKDVGITPNYVREILSNEKPDRVNLIPHAIKKLSDWKAKQETLKKQIKKVASQEFHQ